MLSFINGVKKSLYNKTFLKDKFSKYQIDLVVIFFTQSVMARKLIKQHFLQSFLHQGRSPLLWQNLKIIAKIGQELNKVDQAKLASTAVRRLKEVMESKAARTNARIATARKSLEFAGDNGKHSNSQLNYEQNLAEMTPSELSAIIGRSEGEQCIQSMLLLSDKWIYWIFFISNKKIGFYVQLSDRLDAPL